MLMHFFTILMPFMGNHDRDWCMNKYLGYYHLSKIVTQRNDCVSYYFILNKFLEW